MLLEEMVLLEETVLVRLLQCCCWGRRHGWRREVGR